MSQAPREVQAKLTGAIDKPYSCIYSMQNTTAIIKKWTNNIKQDQAYF